MYTKYETFINIYCNHGVQPLRRRVFNFCIVFYHVSYFCDFMCILCVFYMYAAISVIINDDDDDNKQLERHTNRKFTGKPAGSVF